MPAPNPERLMALLQQFINAPSWGQSRRVLEQHPELLTPEADALLGRVLEQYQDDPRAVRMLTEHRDLLRRCRAEGVEAAFADLESGDADPEAALRALMEQAESDPEARAALEEMERQMEEHPLLQAVQILSEARSTKEVLEVVQTHPILLSDEADAMLRQSIANARRVGEAGMARHIEERYQILRQIREQGLDRQQLAALAAAQEQMDAALADLPEHLQRVLADVTSQEELEAALEEHPELAEALAQAAGGIEPSGQDALVQTIYQFINADTWTDSLRVVQNHSELLTDEADDLLGQILEQANAQDEADAVRILEEHRELLRRCREAGVKAAFAEKMGLPEGVDPMEAAAGAQAQAALPEEVRRELAELVEREGISSQEELEAALEEHPELREALAQAAQQAAAGPGPGEIPEDVKPILQELSQPARRADMPRRVQLCEQALSRVDREAHAPLWAALQNTLANSLAQTPLGERAENLERAIHHYTLALEVYTRQADPERWAATQNNLALAYADRIRGERADNLERAIHHYAQALEVYTRQAFPADWAMTQNNLATAYSDRIRGERADNLERAIHHYAQALDVYTSETWPERARDVRRRFGAAHFAARHWSAAHQAFAVAQELTEQFYAAALLREVREQEVGANARMVARDAFCLAQMGRPEDAWLTLERGRARALRQGLDRARARRALASAAPETRARYQTLTGKEQGLRQALGLPEDDPRHRPYHEVRDELAAVTQELRDLQHDLLEAAGVELGVPDVATMQALPLLQNSRAGLLSLALTDHGAVAFLLTGEGMEHTVVDDLSRDEVEALVIQRAETEDDEPGGWLGAYFPQFAAAQARREAAVWAGLMPDSEEHRRAFAEADANWRAARGRWRTTMTETLDDLGRRLWPALDRLLQEAGVERVVLVPQGMLFLLPLHACPLGDTGERVCDRYSVAYAPAGAVLARLASREVGAVDHSLLVANPTGDLRHTPSEALAIRHALGDARTLWEDEATEASVVEAARDAGVIHFSGHGSYDWQAPEESGLLLRDPDAERVNPRTGEGIDPLTVAEMREALRLSRTRLVTLSACETGLTEIRRGLADEYIGLPGILLQAGARAVVASLWAVDDLATALLMWQFYQRWDQGSVPAAEALQGAQKWLRTRTREQVKDALEELNQLWEPWRQPDADPAMRDRAIEQEWVIKEVRRRLDQMGDPPFAHPYWWAGFQAVGDVL